MTRTKYHAIIDDLHHRIEEQELVPGDAVESISSISRRYAVARETAVKAYKVLRQEGLIDAIPGKGFFLVSDQLPTAPRVMMILSSFNPYMQVLYNAYEASLPPEVRTDVYFHHHNIEVFSDLIMSYSRRYTHLIIKTFAHDRIPELLESLDPKHLLLLDRDEYVKEDSHAVCQDFSSGFHDVVLEMEQALSRYSRLFLLRSEVNPHPQSTFTEFSDILSDLQLPGGIISQEDIPSLCRQDACIVLSDEELVQLLDLTKRRRWQLGSDFGIIAYNDSPLYPFVGTGITTISADFSLMGRTAARFILTGKPVHAILRPELTFRGSI